MRECWLRPNRRVLSTGLAVPFLIVIAGITMALSIAPDSELVFLRWSGRILVVTGVLMSLVIIYLMRLPRLGYEDGFLLVYLSSTRPIRVPIELVECFFLGQTSTRLTRSAESEAETATIVVRLAESATQWHHRDVKPVLGRWCEGYITIYGTWCEPINTTIAQQLNDRLVAAHRTQRDNAQRDSE